MTHDVFISHSIDDADVGQAVCAELEARGLACWFAARDAAAADDWDEALARSRAIILILSAGSADAPQVLREAERARRHNLPVIIFRIEDVTPSAALQRATEDLDTFDALTPPIGPHLDYLGDRVALLLLGGGRHLTGPPRPFHLPGRRSRNWLPIIAAGLAGLAAIALAAMVSGR